MDKKHSQLKMSGIGKVKSLEKPVTLRLSKPKINNDSTSPAFSKSQKKQIQAQAKQVKNKIGKFLQKIKTKADGLLKSNELTHSKQQKLEQVEESSLTTDPYQFRKKNTIVLQKGLKKGNIQKPLIPSSQYYNLKQNQTKKLTMGDLHPFVKDIKNFSDTITTTSSDKKQPRLIRLQDFQIGKKLGSGKYGNVYKVRHKRTGLVYALKKINKNEVDEIMIKQITHEIKIQLMMDHPNIVRLYSYFNDEQSLFLLLQLFTSGHLYDLLQKKVFIEQKTTRGIVKQICQGLMHLHKNNIIHRDVKLQNILYQMGMVKICDFGWSIQTQDLRETFCGTPLYIAPEILLQKGYDKKIDVWCVGILTYELLFGHVPFQIKQQKDFLKIIVQQVTFPQQPAVCKSTKNFIIKCLMKDPELRPTMEQLLIHPFLQKHNQQTKSAVDLF